MWDCGDHVSNGPEPPVFADCLTVGVGGGSAAVVFFNGPEVRVPKDCLCIVTHPSVRGRSASRVRGTGEPLGRRWTACGGPVAGLLAARAAAAALLVAGHHDDIAAARVVVERGGIADVPLPMTARSLLKGSGQGHEEELLRGGP